MSKVRNKPTAEGRELGRMMAQWADEAEPRARLKVPEIPPRCASCAFRHGDHTPNGSPTTQMDALKCVMENIFFGCHEPARKDEPCSGWVMMMLGKESHEPVGECPWPFSDETARGLSPDPRRSGAIWWVGYPEDRPGIALCYPDHEYDDSRVRLRLSRLSCFFTPEPSP